MLDEGVPIFQQIADQLSCDIVDGVLSEGGKVPSSNEFAAFYRINPATAAKGINLLVDDGVLEKRRGIGMFVVQGAQMRLIALRRKEFAQRFVDPLVAEAGRVGIGTDELIEMIRQPPDRARSDRSTGDTQVVNSTVRQEVKEATDDGADGEHRACRSKVPRHNGSA